MNNPVLILYLEDNPRDAAMVQDCLQQAGIVCELRIASNRAQYETALAQTRFDLILSDYSLPDYDGMAGLALARETRPDIPFIIISGTIGDETAVAAMKAGAHDYLMKDKLARLGPAIERALHDAQVRREHQQVAAYHELSGEVLQLLNASGDLQTVIRSVIAAVKDGTGCDAVGLRLQDGDDFPYFAQQGFSEEFLLTENSLLERGADGGVCRNKDGSICLEGTCGLVLSGKTNPANPLCTRGGSWWTNDSFPLLELPPDNDHRHHPRNQCIHQGYASAAIVPIRNKDRIVGLLHLNDRRKGRFCIHTIECLQGIAAHIGAALMRNRTEATLLASEHEFRAMFELASIGMAQADPHTGQFVRVNQRMCKITCYSADELLQLRIVELTHPEDRHEDSAALQRVVRGEAPDYRMEKRYLRKDGTVAWVNVNVTVIRDVAGQALRTMATIEDITTRKQAEVELREKCEHLERINKVTVGRELRMIELKAEINTLLKAAGQPDKYKIV